MFKTFKENVIFTQSKIKTECSLNRKDEKLVLNFLFFFLICMYTHIVKQVTKHLWICRNYKRYLALDFQNWDQKTEVWVKSGNRTKNSFRVGQWGRLQHGAIIHPQGGCSFNDRQGPKYHSRGSYLPGRGSPEQSRQALKW